MAKLDYCVMSSDVYLVCKHHALSTEVEEIMGLLIGYVDEEKRCCHISHTLLLKRLDKRKDRVEISPELLASSITLCEDLNAKRHAEKIRIANTRSASANSGGGIGDEEPELRVVGWYHSHPHITVFPSDVDLRTQESYQSGVDRTWIGLIFGVYNFEESTGISRFQYIAFQTVRSGSRMEKALIPVIIKPSSSLGLMPSRITLENLKETLKILLEEEQEAYAKKKAQLQDYCKDDYFAYMQASSTFNRNVFKISRSLGAPLLAVLRNTDFHVATKLKNEGSIWNLR